MPRSFSLGDHYEEFIDTQIKSGRYQTATEVVRDALRSMEAKEQLRAEIQKGIESGTPVPADEVFGNLRKRMEARRPKDQT